MLEIDIIWGMADGTYVEQEFVRDTNYIADRILADPDPSKAPGGDAPVGAQ